MNRAIILPCYGQSSYTAKLLPTIKLKKNDHLVLIDNGSPDDTLKVLNDFCGKVGGHVIRIEENIGCAGAWDSGLFFAVETLNCEKFAILNNDTLLRPDTLETIFTDLDRPNVGMATAINVMNQFENEEAYFKAPNPKESSYSEEPDFSCFALNKLCLDKVGYFDEAIFPAYYEDNDYHYRMKLEGLKAQKNSGNIYWHYGSRTKLISTLYGEYINTCFLRNEDYFKSKWGGMPGHETFTIPFDGLPPKMKKLLTFEDYKKEIGVLPDWEPPKKS
jgi:GT2 family glycosyltransferase